MNILDELRQEGYHVGPLRKLYCPPSMQPRRTSRSLLTTTSWIPNIRSSEDVDYLLHRLEAGMDIPFRHSVVPNKYGVFDLVIWWESEGTEEDWIDIESERLEFISKMME